MFDDKNYIRIFIACKIKFNNELKPSGMCLKYVGSTMPNRRKKCHRTVSIKKLHLKHVIDTVVMLSVTAGVGVFSYVMFCSLYMMILILVQCWSVLLNR